MKKKITVLLAIYATIAALFIAIAAAPVHQEEPEAEPEIIAETFEEIEEPEGLPAETLDFLARCVEAEAANQGLLGKCLVVDVILNRVDSEAFPNTIEDVIKARNQFAVYANGRMDRVTPTEETFEAIELELLERTDTQILYFNTGGFKGYYTPAFQHKDHYFGY